MLFFKQKSSLEAEVLRDVGQLYIIFSSKGEFLRDHPNVSEVLRNLGLHESDMQTRDALISGLKNLEMIPDDAARQILNDQSCSESKEDFSCFLRRGGHYFLVQVKSVADGAYAFFKDVTYDYTLLTLFFTAKQKNMDNIENKDPAFAGSLYSIAGNMDDR